MPSLRMPGVWGLLLVAVASAAAGQTSPEPVDIDIAAQPLASALKELAEQADLQILFVPDAVGARKAPALRGKFTPEGALKALLAGTSLDFVHKENDLYVIREPPDTGEPVRNANQKPADDSKRDASDKPRDLSERVAGEPPGARRASALGELMVTGTHLPGAIIGSQVISIGRADIDRMGFSTVLDVIRTLPQNFGGGATEDTILGPDALTNSTEATALNLRGLGSSSTLVLVNGRRLAASGTEGAFVDISNIPLVAVERIDVLPDAASAYYGSEAVGGVINLVLRSEFTGAETQGRYGAATSGSLDERQASQVLGGSWGSGNALLALEYFDRGNLPAGERPLAASDLRRFGGDNFDTRNGNPATIVRGTQTWAIPSGQDGSALTPADLVPGTENRYDLRAGGDLLAEQKRWTVTLAARHEWDDGMGVFADVLHTERRFDAVSSGVRSVLRVPATNPFHVNPDGSSAPVQVAYDFADDLGRVGVEGDVRVTHAALGGGAHIGRDWRVTGYVAYAMEELDRNQEGLVDFGALSAALADSNVDTAFNPFGDGSHTSAVTLARIRAHNDLATSSGLRSLALGADGRLAMLPAGPLELAAGIERRRQSLQTLDRTRSSVSLTITTDGELHRTIDAVFGELSVPLIGTRNRRTGAERLDLSVAGRYEEYSDFGNVAVPGVGILWSPVTGLTLRSAWSQSYRAPTLADLDTTRARSQILPLVDSSSSNGLASVLLWLGKNADLQEERATSWTIGAEVTPSALPTLSLGITWFDIEFRNRIQGFNLALNDLANPTLSPQVTRSPSEADRQRVCSGSLFAGLPEDCLSAPIDALLDLRIHNLGVTRTRGVDWTLAYSIVRPTGTLDLGLEGTWLLAFDQSPAAGAPVQDLLDTQNNPLDLRLRASVGWSHAGFDVTCFVNYADSYHDVASEPDRRVGSWMTVDLTLGYRTPAGDPGWAGNLRLSLSAENAFDREPPFLNNRLGLGYDPENADLSGRIVRFDIRKHW